MKGCLGDAVGCGGSVDTTILEESRVEQRGNWTTILINSVWRYQFPYPSYTILFNILLMNIYKRTVGAFW